MKASIPIDEEQRLAALRSYKILDTESEAAYDDLTFLALQICKCPIALITFVDSNRQWFKSKIGLSLAETSRDISICAHTILQSDVLIIPDTLADERFATNPVVISDPKVRFYAGAPLITSEGHKLGTI